MSKIKDADVLWEANPGRQTEYLSAVEYEVLYGGAAGGGKTQGSIAVALRYINEPDHHAIIFRTTYPELEDMMNESRALYQPLGGIWRGRDRCWTFPSGARISFGNLPDEKACFKYHGPAYTMLIFDELCSWKTDAAYIYMQSRLRKRADSNCRLMVRATCNPIGPGKAWVQARFGIQPDGSPTKFKDEDTGRMRRFLPALISDNPKLACSEYEITLNALSTAKKKALRDGRWDAMEGAYFQYLPVGIFDVQPHWTFYGGFDYGWAHRSAFILLATDDDGHGYVVDTHSASKTSIAAHATAIKAMLARHDIEINTLSRIAAGHDLWAKRGEHGVMADTYASHGIHFEKAIIDRINGWQALIDAFGDPHAEEPIWPRMTIHPRNGFLMKCLPLLQHDENRSEDCAKMDMPTGKPEEPSDDECDALRYGNMLIMQGGAGLHVGGF